jgi:hypothetical protein
MWRKASIREEQELLARAIAFTGDAALYGSYMRRVIREWPISCEQNMTDISINRKAWVGHAATCMAINCPEYITRMAWAHLSDEQQRDANKQAQNAIDEWEATYANNLMDQLCLSLI